MGVRSVGKVTWVDWEVTGWVEQADLGVAGSGAAASLGEGWNVAHQPSKTVKVQISVRE